ncbi:MAG: hypothetical protein CMJ40_06205 [Phycisphaerae bacterium]|nr:hypothetical protein [Phycisphaerae bacterium]
MSYNSEKPAEHARRLTSHAASWLVLVGCAAVCPQAFADETHPWGDQGWIMPQMMNRNTTGPATDEDWLRFGWDTFIAMNWPHDENAGNPGAPDANADIVTSYNSPSSYPSTVWWTYNDKFQLFYQLPSGTPDIELYPGTWSNPLSPKPLLDGHQVIGDFSKAGSLSNRLRDQLNEAFIDAPLIDADGNFVLYQIFINQSFWEYALNTGYYDGSKQIDDVNAGTFINMPKWGDSNDDVPYYDNIPPYAQQGAMSVKVAWKQLTEDEIDSGRYYTRDVYYENNTDDLDDVCANPENAPITVGLVGMHILRLTPLTVSTWFWSSFEHVDNATGPDANFNAGCQIAASGYTRRGTCIDAVTDVETDPWLTDYPPLNADIVENYPDGLCGPQTNSTLSQVFRIEETQANLDSTPVQSVNTEYQTALAGTPWQYYEQVNTTQPRSVTANSDCDCFVPPVETNFINVCDMTNTSMESYSQYNFLSQTSSGNVGYELAPIISFQNRQTMNCINCHAYAAPLGTPAIADPADPTWRGLPYDNSMQIFTFLMSGATQSCPSDINKDSIVDILDILLVIEGWGGCLKLYCRQDVNEDGDIDIADLLLVIDNWVSCVD